MSSVRARRRRCASTLPLPPPRGAGETLRRFRGPASTWRARPRVSGSGDSRSRLFFCSRVSLLSGDDRSANQLPSHAPALRESRDVNQAFPSSAFRREAVCFRNR
jgi:hypothetical protein